MEDSKKDIKGKLVLRSGEERNFESIESLIEILEAIDSESCSGDILLENQTIVFNKTQRLKVIETIKSMKFDREYYNV